MDGFRNARNRARAGSGGAYRADRAARLDYGGAAPRLDYGGPPPC
jgi:hypothetical protein